MSKKFVPCFLLVCMLFLMCGSDLHALMVSDKFDIGGYLQNETAFSTFETGDILWSENKALVYGTYNFSSELRAFFRVQGYYDAINAIQSHDYRDISGDRYMDRQTYFRQKLWQPKSYTTSEFLKELFIDYSRPEFDLRIGKQQFAWGVTDGLKVLDVIYPQDFRKFNQEDFEESRIPLWSVKFDYYVRADSEIQLIYLPRFEPAFFPGGGHPFCVWGDEFFDVLDNYGVNVGGGMEVSFDVKSDEPANTFDNGEYGVMWRENYGDWSYSLNFLSHYTDVSGAYLTGMDTINIGIIIPSHIELTKRHNRMYSVGGSLDATLSNLPVVGTWIIRAEGIYNFDNIIINVPDRIDPTPTSAGNYLPVPIVGPSGNVVWEAGVPFPETEEIDDFTYALGFDKYVLTDVFLSFQFIHHHIMDYKSSFVNPVTGKQADENDYWGTFLIQKDWMNEKLWTKILNVVGRHGDYWIQPQVSYLFRDKFKVIVQGNFYGGTHYNMWSRFDDSDNVALRLTYQF